MPSTLPPPLSRYLFFVASFLLTPLSSQTALYSQTASGVDFARDVRPILSQFCFKCHGPDDKSLQGNLRLDSHEAAILAGDSGERAIVPGHPDQSELVRRILSEEADEQMPPPATKLQLSPAQKEVLQQWIAEGAPYQPHWAFIPPQSPSVPLPSQAQVKTADASWGENPIDAFVLARLQTEGLSPSSRAEPAQLLRRLYLDLVGVPPTPEQTAAYVADPSIEHYHRIVDQLLASPAYGERWARRWLDLARYADTNGYEKDRPRSMWPYRNWVINAINDDLPFDQFTIKQIAGDLLPNATIDDRVATGFHRNTMLNEEGGIDPLEFRFHAMVDRIGTTGTVWLGMSVACAQCHTHKYDPITHKEYYQMMAFLNNAEEPEIPVTTDSSATEIAAVQSRIAQHKESGLKSFPIDLPEVQYESAEWLSANATSGATLTLQPDGSYLVSGNSADKDTYRLVAKSPAKSGWLTSIRVEMLQDPSLPKNGPGRAPNGNLVLTEMRANWIDSASAAASSQLQFTGASANHQQQGFPPENVCDQDEKSGWALDPIPQTPPIYSTYFIANPTFHHADQSRNLAIELSQLYGGSHTIGRFKITLGWLPVESVVSNFDASDATSNQEQLSKATRDLVERSLAAARGSWQETLSKAQGNWKIAVPAATSALMARLRVEEAGTLYAEGDQPKRDEYTLQFEPVGSEVTAILIEAIPDPRLPRNGPGRTYYEGPIGDFFLSEVTAEVSGELRKMKAAKQSSAGGGNNVEQAIDGDPLSGWTINGSQGKRSFAAFQLEQPIDGSKPFALKMLFERYHAAPLGKFRVWFTNAQGDNLLGPLPPEFDASTENRPEWIAEITKQFGDLSSYFFRTAPQMAVWQRKLDQIKSSIPMPPTTLVMQERPADLPRATLIHHRGEFLSPRETVEAKGPSFLPPVVEGRAGNRLDFAKWLVRPDHPLTPRVIVNRQWSLLFGRGLVTTEEDFGYQGSLPTHPELLDWLASQWGSTPAGNDGNSLAWSMKQLHRLMVTSATYQQSSSVDSERLLKDPENRFLSRGPRKRLEAEQVRDSLLAVSGLLDRRMGGPSVYPPQPASISTEGAYGQLAWQVSGGGDRYRRGLYTFAKRTAPYAMLQTFDGPSGEACLAKRLPTNTPLQALTMLNDSVVLDVSQTLGRWAIQQADDPSLVQQDLFRRIMSREPDADERAMVAAFIDQESARLKGDAAMTKKITGDVENSTQAAYVLLSRALLNTDEFLTRN